MKQTAVVFLREKYISQNGLLFSEDFELAEAMEENRLKEAVISTFKNVENYATGLTAEEYYNEQFKSE